MARKRRRTGIGRRFLVFVLFLVLTAGMLIAGFSAGRYIIDHFLFPEAGSGHERLNFARILLDKLRPAGPGKIVPAQPAAPGSGSAGAGAGTGAGTGSGAGAGTGAGTGAGVTPGTGTGSGAGGTGVLSVRAGLNPFEVYCAQVAAYRTSGLANRRIAELEGYGWAGYLDQIDAEDLIKVRVGVFGSGGPARDLAEQIRAAGFSCIPVTVTMGNGQETWQGASRALLETMRDCTRQASYLIWEEAASWSEHSLKKATLIQVADRGLKFRPGVNALAASLKAQPEDRTAAASRELVTQLLIRAQAHLDALDALKVSPATDTRARILAVRTLGALVEQYQRVLKAQR